MALIKCTECGKMISTRAKECPHCGCPVEQAKSPQKNCPECGQEVDASVMVCPNCAFPFEVLDKEEINIDADSMRKMNLNKRERPLWKNLLLLLIIGVALIFTYKFIFTSNTNNNGASNSPTEYQSPNSQSLHETNTNKKREVYKETRTVRANKMENSSGIWKVCGTVTLTLTIEDGNARVTELNGHRCNLPISASQIDYSDWCCKEGSYFYCFDCRL